MIKEAFKQWKHELKEEHLQIKIQNKWFEELKKTDLYRQLKKYKWLRNGSILIDYIILVGCYLSIYTLPVSKLNAILGSHITKETYQNIVFIYTILVLLLMIFSVFFTVVLSKDKSKDVRVLNNMLIFFLFGGVNYLLLCLACIIQPAYFIFILGLVIVKVGIRKWKELQREAVFLSYKEVNKEGKISHYKRHGIRFEMEDEPRIYRMDYFQEENKNEELRS
ncbi:hypothetical protein [Enterococcus sp. DIV0765a]|jgi:hypothetical protein|uniref:hypothetical protein n=1 Tax=Enterococcus sp. DIV0765a TaxID=2774828 RepID=UPI003D2A9C9E